MANTPTPQPGQSPKPPAKKAPAKKAAPRKQQTSGQALDQLSSDLTGKTQTTSTKTPLPTSVWGNPDAADYAQQNIVTLHVDGLSFSVNELVASRFSGFIHDLVLAGYHPKSVGGYNNRPITGGKGKSNHAYGAAIDIDPDLNPRVVGKTAAHALPANVEQLAAKWGLYWGGNYKNSKDYMHFEALGAPRTPGSPKGGTAPTVTTATAEQGPAGPEQAAAAKAASAAAPSDTLPPNASMADIKKYVAEHYGYAAAFLNVPEIGAILLDAAKNGDDRATLQGKLFDTKWWKTTSAAARDWDTLNLTDHATAKSKVEEQIRTLGAQAAKAGIIIDPLRLHDLAVNSLRLGWDAQHISDALLSEGHLDLTGKKPSDALATRQALKQTAANFHIQLSDKTLDQWTQGVVGGTSSQQGFDAYIKEQAKSLYPWMTDHIDRGGTVEQWANPYREKAGQLLEIDPASVDFNQPKYSRALTQVDTASGQRGPMSLSAWDTYLRNLPEYNATRQASDQAAQFAQTLTSQFAKAAY